MMFAAAPLSIILRSFFLFLLDPSFAAAELTNLIQKPIISPQFTTAQINLRT